ncbi:MAG: 4Fe-4S dicluster domain-containing protein [Euryarchaeota archaeon]|nr:4Fe-4S dicluster domain-containing protein [Euryarchaeota archaeon]
MVAEKPSPKRIDPAFKNLVLKEEGGDHLLRCYACGTCSGGCPVAELEATFRPHEIIRMSIFGFKDELLSSNVIWLCSFCYNCYERCPRDVKPAMVIRALRNIAARQGYVPNGIKMIAESVYKIGRVTEITDFENEARADLGLPAVEPVDIEKMKKVLKKAGLEKVLPKEE